MSLDRRMKALGDHRVDADVDGVLRRILARDRAIQVRRFAAVGVITVLAVVGGLAAANRDSGVSDRAVVAGLPPDGPAPIEVGASPVELVLHADEMKEGDRWLAAFVVNTSAETVVDQYLDIIVERWNGTAWIATGERTVRSCDDVLCVSAPTVEGGLGLLKTPVELAPGDELGPLWIDFADQQTGEYRLVVGSGGTTLTTARLDIVDEATGLLPLDQRQDRLVFGDSLIEPGAEAPSRVRLLGPDGPSLASLDDSATVQRWNGAEFETTATVTRTEVTDVDGEVGDGYRIPPLDPGAYRLAATLDGEPINGWLFVRELDATEASPPTVSLAPMLPREGPAVAGLSDEFLVWGGVADSQTRMDDGAMYDVVSDSWEPLPDAPLAGGFNPVATATNDRFAVFSDDKAAFYDPRLQTWESMPDPGAVVNDAFFVSDTLLADSGRGLLSFRGGQWDAVESEFANDVPTLVATDRELIVLDAADEGIRGEAYDPVEDRWRSIAAPPTGGNVPGDAAWTGDEVVWVAYDLTFPATAADPKAMSAAAYDPDTDTWRMLPPVPVRFAEGIPNVGMSGEQLYVIRYPALLVFVDGFWLPVPARGDIWPAEFVDSSIGPIGFREHRFVAMELSARTEGPLSLQVGRLTIEIEGGDRVVGSELLAAAGPGAGMTVDVETSTGACAMENEFGSDGLEPPHPPRERVPGEVEVRFDDGGPLLTVTCADTSTAMRLAESAKISP